MAVRFQLRRDTASNWASVNPVLELGEPGVETDTLKLKIGDGTTAWSSLGYTISNQFGDLNGLPTTLAGYGITDAGDVTGASTTTFTNKSGAISQWTNDSNYLTSVPAQTFASLTSKPTTVAGYGITDAFDGAYGSLSGAPTLGTAAATASTAYATAAQGTTADSAIQPNTSPTLTNATLTGYLAGPATFTIDPAAVGDNTGKVVIAGDLQVDGTQTTINSTTVAIDDLNFSIATDAADSAAANGAGITVGGAGANFVWNSTYGSMTLNKELRLDNNKGLFFANAAVNATLGLKADASDNITFRQNGQWDRLVIKNDGVEIAGALTTGSSVSVGADAKAMQSGFDNIQVGGNLTLNVDSTGAGAGVYMGNNVYRDVTNSRWEYIYTDEASQYVQANGEHIFRQAVSGTADDAITWTTPVKIDSSGNVGIGTDAPDTELHVFNSDSGATPTGNTVATFEGNDNTEISILGGSSSILALNFGHSGDNNEGIVYFNTTDGSENLQLQSTKDITLVATSANGTAGDINFKSYNTTIMHVDGANNNVGIGDDGPSSRLTVKKNSSRTTDVENMVKIDHTSSGTTGVGFGSAIYFLGERENGVTQGMGRLIYEAEVNSGTDISSGFLVQTATAGAASTKLRVTHDGNVGIGETSTAKLGNSLGTLLNVNNANIIGNGTSGSYLTYNARYNSTWLRQETSGVGILSFTNAGNLTYRTSASGTAGTEPSLAEIIATGESDPAFIAFAGASQVRITMGTEGTPGTNTANWIRGNGGLLQYNAANSDHAWEVGGTERLRLQANGAIIQGPNKNVGHMTKTGSDTVSFTLSCSPQPSLWRHGYIIVKVSGGDNGSTSCSSSILLYECQADLSASYPTSLNHKGGEVGNSVGDYNVALSGGVLTVADSGTTFDNMICTIEFCMFTGNIGIT